jgi:hypothetical protein
MLVLFNNAVYTGGVRDLSNSGRRFVDGGLESIYIEREMAY